MLKSYIRTKLQTIIHSLHKFFFPGRYKAVTELLVPDLLNIPKIRLGRVGDGTYILPEGLLKGKINLFGLGIADDISFEEDFIRLYPDTTVLAFDPSISELPSVNDKIKFESKGVAGTTSKTGNFISIPDIFKENNLDPQNQTVVKIKFLNTIG